jgi:hypothetical protein
MRSKGYVQIVACIPAIEPHSRSCKADKLLVFHNTLDYSNVQNSNAENGAILTTFEPFPLKNPFKPSILPNLIIDYTVEIPIYSGVLHYLSILRRSKGFVTVLDIVPAIPPVIRYKVLLSF